MSSSEIGLRVTDSVCWKVRRMAKLKTKLPALIARKELEMNARYTQADIAEQAKVSPATISRWIRGRVDRFDADTIEKLCTYFRCEIGDLLYLDWESTD